ncbi:hypothetical protein CHUAL_008500 [Chamberlinius hualienensis]|uniref:Cytochrome P450 3200B3 n=1 Tax=Chamberlinius hualienensis TaxID=1551368 RepID=A0A1J1DVN4_9MYRI|nr:cytochrome P450 3200B3 [Chamberlinius hualienensis]
MDLWNIFAWIFAIIILSVTYWYMTIPKNLPPGAAGLPIVGYLPFFNLQPHITLDKLAQKFGNIYYVYMGSQLSLVLNDFESIKQAFLTQGDTFAGRCHLTEFEDINGEISGIIMTDGEFWKQHRRFILRNLRDSGVGKLTIEPLILNEIQYFLTELRKHDGKGHFDLKHYLSASLTNNINILLHGKRYDYAHPMVADTLQAIKDFEEIGQVLPLETFFPWLKPLLIKLNTKRMAKLVNLRTAGDERMASVIKETASTFVAGQTDNYVQAFLNERNNRLKHNPNEAIFTDKGLIAIGLDLTNAGTDTSASTLAWTAMYMAKYPKIQRKVQDEIDSVIGQREPSYNDRNNTPYVEAIINEIHRIVSLVPVSVPHRVMHDTTLCGYNIPKDTMVLPNLRAVHYDQKLWGDPENFRPERFIGSNGECLKPEYLLPFSIGKRACAGEPLARMELYLYFVSLMQNFTFLEPEGLELSFESIPGFLRQPKIRLISIKSR